MSAMTPLFAIPIVLTFLPRPLLEPISAIPMVGTDRQAAWGIGLATRSDDGSIPCFPTGSISHRRQRKTLETGIFIQGGGCLVGAVGGTLGYHPIRTEYASIGVRVGTSVLTPYIEMPLAARVGPTPVWLGINPVLSGGGTHWSYGGSASLGLAQEKVTFSLVADGRREKRRGQDPFYNYALGIRWAIPVGARNSAYTDPDNPSPMPPSR